MAIDYSEFVTAPEYEDGMPVIKPELSYEERLNAHLLEKLGPPPTEAAPKSSWERYNRRKRKAQKEFQKQDALQRGGFADALGQGLYALGDEAAGVLGATIGTFDPNMPDSTWGERYKGIRDVAREQAANYAELNPKMSLAGNIAGGLLTAPLGGPVNVARTLATSKAAPTIGQKLLPFAKQGAAHGAVFGAGMADEMEDIPASMLTSAALGAGFGAGIPAAAQGVRNLLARRMKPQVNITQQAGTTAPAPITVPMTKGVAGPPAPAAVSPKVEHANPAYARAVERLQKLFSKDKDFNLTTGQKTGSIQKTKETTLAPTAPTIREQLKRNTIAVQRKMMEMAGFRRNHDDYRHGVIGEDIIAETQKKFNQRYKELIGQGKMIWNKKNVNDRLDEIVEENLDVLDDTVNVQLDKIINTFRQRLESGYRKTGAWTRENAQAFRSALAKQQRDTANSNPALSSLYKRLKNLVDDEVAAVSGQGANKAKLDLEYARFKSIRNTHDGSAGAGSLQPDNFPIAGVLRKTKKVGADKPFAQMLEDAQMVLKDPFPDSGTSQRLSLLPKIGAGGGASVGALTGLADPISSGAAGYALGSVADQLRNLGLAKGFTGAGLLNTADIAGSLVSPVLGGTGLLGGEMHSPIGLTDILDFDYQ